MAKKKKDKQKPRKPKSGLIENMPRPKPITWRGPRHFVLHAREYPIYGSWIMEDWKEMGITPVVIARLQSPDKVIFANYMVDFFCLGVKDAFCNGDLSLRKFEDNLADLCSGKPMACDTGLAHELVYGAVDFARRYGFEPHPDFKLASMVLDPPDVHPPRHRLEFGRNGKPYFVAGPYDNSRAILSKLERTAGAGNYDYLAMLEDLD